MSTLILPMLSPSSLKRTFDEAGLDIPIEDHNARHSSMPPLSRALPTTSEVPALDPTPSTPAPFNPPTTHETNSMATTARNAEPKATMTPPITKNPKLTFAEKEAKKIEKEFRERQMGEERAKKEEERIRKEEEKSRREEERAKKVEDKKIKDAEREEKRKIKEEKDRIREEEKAKKEEEKRLKDEEKNRKARSQLRLNAFFGQPSIPARSSTGSPSRDEPSPCSSRRSSIAEISALESKHRSRSASLARQKPQLSDYERTFPPFFVQSHTLLAPFNRFSRDDDGKSYARSKIDEGIGQGRDYEASASVLDMQTLLHIAPHRKRLRYRATPNVKDIVARMHGTSRHPIDLTESSDDRLKPADLLRSVSMKVLKFAEDVRPPYIGTYTKLTDHTVISKLSRNPFGRDLPETNYDYDSEAEWEEPGEGEDLNSEGEEELDEEEEDEMEGFLDDEEAADVRAVKRRPLLGDLEPTCTGLCWTGQPSAPDLSTYCIDMLTENPTFPIDPYSTNYWLQATPTKIALSSIPAHQSTLMDPPRLPLNPINGSNAFPHPAQSPLGLGQNQYSLGQTKGDPFTNTLNNPKPIKRLIPYDLVEDFKKAVQGSDLTKLGLVEVLKKRFPKQSKDVLKDTLDVVAERIGGKLAEKRWVLREGV